MTVAWSEVDCMGDGGWRALGLTGNNLERAAGLARLNHAITLAWSETEAALVRFCWL